MIPNTATESQTLFVEGYLHFQAENKGFVKEYT